MDDSVLKKVIDDLIKNGVIKLDYSKLSRYVQHQILHADESVIEKIAKKYDILPEEIYNITTVKIARVLEEMKNVTIIKQPNGNNRYKINDLNDWRK